jgi:hypothetical protein
MDAADTTTMTTSGTTITRMNDKSGNGYNTTVIGGAPALTANAINGLSAISFNGSSYMTGSNANTTATASFFLIATLASGQGAGQQYTSAYCFSRAVAGAACYNEVQSINGLSCQNAATSLAMSPQRTNANGPTYTLSNYNTAFMHTTVCNGTTMAGYGNGNPVGTTSSSGNFAYTFYNIGSQTSQAVIFYNYNWIGYVGELIAFNNALSDPQRQQVEGYLAQKWGLTAYLPAGHPGLTQTLYNGRVYQSRIPLSLNTNYYQNFNPKQVSGCLLWLDGVDPAGTGIAPASGTLTSWIDKSGSGNNATGGVSPSYSSSSRGVVFSTSGSTYLQTSITAVPSAETVFCVFNPTNAAINNNNDMFSPSANYGLGFQILGNGTNFALKYDVWAVAGYAATSYTISPGQITLGSGTFSSQTATTYLNGGVSVGGPTSTSPYPSGSSTRRVGSGAGGDYYNGTIYEIVYYNTVITTLERQQVEGYLAWKWGIQTSLPSNHPYLNIPPGLPWETTITRGLTNKSGIVATGGTITTANGFRIHTFTTVGTTSGATNFIITSAATTGANVQILVVGGGGGGGTNTGGGGGGGGAAFVSSQIIQLGSYAVTVGAAGNGSPGAGVATNGGNSSFNSIVGIGGGAGGSYSRGDAGSSGGCGGGGCGANAAAGSATQAGGNAGGSGNTGGPAGGGGGMGSVGSNGTLPLGPSSWLGGNGGNGGRYTIGGTTYIVSGGGGAGSYNAGTGSAAGSGGTGGGGNGALSGVGSSATYYGGGGGGAGGGAEPAGGSGYQGIVIIAYPFP